MSLLAKWNMPTRRSGIGLARILCAVPRQNFIRDEERRDSRPCRREYDQHCFDRAQRFWGTGTRARVPRTYIYIRTHIYYGLLPRRGARRRCPQDVRNASRTR